jgi:phage gpG-like protein
VRVDVEISGAREAVANLSGVAERAGDPRPALRSVKGVLAKGIAKQFTSRGGHLGTPWPENRPGTLARKARLGQGAETLTASGALGTALTGGKGKRHRVTRSSVSVGVDIWNAHFAHGGTKGAGKSGQTSAPERTIMGISDADNARAVRDVERYILTGRMV